nr:hypothetical protein [Pseudomonas viridiflava]
MMKLLHRLKSWLGQKAVTQQPDIHPEPDEKTSRLQEQKPLLVSPPTCRP